MSVMVDNIDVTKCSLYKDGKCRSLTHLVQGEYLNCNSMCDYGAYARKEQILRLQAENERLKATHLQLQSSELKQHLEKVNCERENYKLRKALEEIREYLQRCKKKKSNFYTLNDVVTDIANNIEKIISEVLDERD